MKLPVLLLTASFAYTLAAETAETVEIGSRLELFVDHHLIEDMDRASLRLHPPVKQPRPKSPLPLRHMVTVIRDGDLYRAWYRGHDPGFTGEKHSGDGGEVVHYAESDDGHEWRFPVLGLHEVGGTRENNVILARLPERLHNFMPFLDTREGIPAAERYKALAGYPGPGNKLGLDKPGHGLFAYTSRDGIRWTDCGEVIPYRPEWHHAFDSPNVSFWSGTEGLYVCYFRTWTPEERLRTISRATSPDFLNWSDPVAMNPNLPGEHLYTNMTHPYVRAPHLYLSLPTRFLPGRGDAPGYAPKDVNVTDILLMTTRAGSERYDRTFTEAFIRPGLDPEQWGNRANYAALNVIPTSPEELSIYHRSGDRYTLRTDGFISVHTGSDEGELLTKPLVFSGSKLILNYSTSAAGEIRVEILDPDGKVVKGFSREDSATIYGDRIEGVVEWKSESDLAALADRPVRLRFVMRECDLYSFRFR